MVVRDAQWYPEIRCLLGILSCTYVHTIVDKKKNSKTLQRKFTKNSQKSHTVTRNSLIDIEINGKPLPFYVHSCALQWTSFTVRYQNIFLLVKRTKNA